MRRPILPLCTFRRCLLLLCLPRGAAEAPILLAADSSNPPRAAREQLSLEYRTGWLHVHVRWWFDLTTNWRDIELSETARTRETLAVVLTKLTFGKDPCGN